MCNLSGILRIFFRPIFPSSILDFDPHLYLR